jgi:methyl-accepting chemotaxis protein
MKWQQTQLTIQTQLAIIIVLVTVLDIGAALAVANFTIQPYLQELLASPRQHPPNIIARFVLAELAILFISAIFALLITGTITHKLQNTARQITSAATNLTSIATQQADKSGQQVWAIRAINHEIVNLSEATAQITHRTAQLAEISAHMLANYESLSPTQLNACIAHISRSMQDISAITRRQARIYTHIGTAIQAVTDTAEQIACDSHDAATNARRLEHLVLILHHLIDSSVPVHEQIPADHHP